MKKIISLILLLCMVLTMTTTVYAASGTTGRIAKYITPDYDMWDDSGIKTYDLIGTLRMSYPDIVFEENIKLITELMNGNRETYIDPNNQTFEEISFQYNLGMHLLPYQLQTYTMASYDLGLTDPIFINLMKQKPNNLDGVNKLIKLEIANYQAMGYIAAVEQEEERE